MNVNDPDSGAIREGEPSFLGNASRGTDAAAGSKKQRRTWRLCCLLGLILILITVAVFAPPFVRSYRARNPYLHNDAAKKFLEYVRAGETLNVDGKQIEKAFDECFVDDLSVAEIGDLLKTGSKRVTGKDIEYAWYFNCEYNGSTDGFVLIVLIAESTSQPGYWYVKGRTGSTLPS